jgi:hypothetical protein
MRQLSILYNASGINKIYNDSATDKRTLQILKMAVKQVKAKIADTGLGDECHPSSEIPAVRCNRGTKGCCLHHERK